MLEEKLSGLDNLFLQIEHPRRLMTVSSLWIFDERLNPSLVYEAIEQLCDDFPRYSTVPAHGSVVDTPIWSNPIGWQPQMNIERYRLKSPSEECLQGYISDMQSRPFDYSKPLWELHAITGLQDEQCAFFWKAHHCLADGLGFIASLLEITSTTTTNKDNKNEKPIIFVDNKKKGSLFPTNIQQQTMGRPIRLTRKPTRFRRNDNNNRRHHQRLLLINDIPDQIYYLLPRWLQWLTSWYFILINNIFILLITLWHDLWVSFLCILPARLSSDRRDFFYTGLQSYKKQVAWSDTIRLKDVRIVRRALKGTVNDVMVLVVTRCIKHYLEEIGMRHDDFVRLFVPINQRDNMDDRSFKNVISGIWGWFSMKDLETSDLLAQVRAEMQAVKSSHIPRLMYKNAVEGILKYFPGFLTAFLPTVNRLVNIPHGVFTNLPGPTEPIEFGGKRIRNIHVLPPQNGKGSLAIGLISYCDQVNITVMADDHSKYPDVAKSICSQFAPEFNLLLREVNMKTTRR
ncbi:hypothetical protein INT45_008328 [Circinella minor]|uniref:Diacylglycerol O-acyltransferase n=1 Tax=Circinella minor TaxID=1195481 RepID=A0A8H7RWT8_9FUNG|nr:hypothetical protein INT45_008328 [Circinella minor]